MAKGTVRTSNRIWDINLLEWVPDTGQLVGVIGDVAIGTVKQGTPGVTSWLVAQERFTMLVGSGTVSSNGNNTLITPTSGKKLQIFYMSYNPSAAVTLGFRFGAAGMLMLFNTITTGGAIVAKDMGEFRNLQGAADESLILNLSSAVSTNWNCFYREVD